MGFIAKDTGGGDFTPVPQGTHLAICNMVIDLGLQETTYDGATSVKHQCYIRWELPHERTEWTDGDGQKHEGPMAIGKFYTVSLSEKANLRKDLQSWRGKAFTPEELDGFDLFNLLGHGCQVTVVHKETNGKTYANVIGVAGWPKGIDRPKVTENPVLRYSEDSRDDFAKLPEWLKTKISQQKPADHSVQYSNGDPGPAAADKGMPADFEDEVPF